MTYYNTNSKGRLNNRCLTHKKQHIFLCLQKNVASFSKKQKSYLLFYLLFFLNSFIFFIFSFLKSIFSLWPKEKHISKKFSSFSQINFHHKIEHCSPKTFVQIEISSFFRILHSSEISHIVLEKPLASFKLVFNFRHSPLASFRNLHRSNRIIALRYTLTSRIKVKSIKFNLALRSMTHTHIEFTR
jgi:hypothetical protein